MKGLKVKITLLLSLVLIIIIIVLVTSKISGNNVQKENQITKEDFENESIEDIKVHVKNVPDENRNEKREKYENTIELPKYRYLGKDVIEKLVVDTCMIKSSTKYKGEFMIVTPKIFASYKEEDKIKVFAMILSSHYILADKILYNEGGGGTPVAITYTKNEDGSYTLEEYKQSRDGSEYIDSIEEFCIMPVSKKKINGIAKKMIMYSGDEGITNLKKENLISHLKENDQYGVSLLEKGFDEPDKYIELT